MRHKTNKNDETIEMDVPHVHYAALMMALVNNRTKNMISGIDNYLTDIKNRARKAYRYLIDCGGCATRTQIVKCAPIDLSTYVSETMRYLRRLGYVRVERINGNIVYFVNRKHDDIINYRPKKKKD